jgi:hypothetical protein
MAGQYLDPSSNLDVDDLQDKAISQHFTKHGEMFSARDMALLAQETFSCSATNLKGCKETLNSLEGMLDIINEEKVILVPYDSDADMSPTFAKGHKAHWGLIVGLALILPYKNKAFDEAKILDGYVSHMVRV